MAKLFLEVLLAYFAYAFQKMTKEEHLVRVY